MTQRKSFSGAAVKTTISSGAFNVGANTLSLTSATGWPTTVNGPFIATIDRGLATQEQISVGARSGLACSAITRGYAGTAEVAHAANATIEHGWDAIAADEANRIASLLTTKGDGLGHDGTQVQREPVGTAGYYQTATPAASTGRSWTAPPSSLVTAKGQVLAASASGVLVPSNTPTNGQVLIGDTTQTAGVRFGSGGFFVCTSTTRPASPTAGMAIWETDTGRVMVYTTAVTGWQPPWNTAWGVVYTVLGWNSAADQTGIGATPTTAVTSGSFAHVARRYLRLEADTWGYQASGTGDQRFGFYRDGTLLKQFGGRNGVNGSAADNLVGVHGHLDVVTDASAHTWDVRVSTSGGSLTVPNASLSSVFSISDIGAGGQVPL